MDKNDLAEQLKYSSSKWIYVVTCNNLLKQIFVPFKVVVLSSIGRLVEGQIEWVQAVKVTPDLKTVFIINGNAYYYHHFEILIEKY